MQQNALIRFFRNIDSETRTVSSVNVLIVLILSCRRSLSYKPVNFVETLKAAGKYLSEVINKNIIFFFKCCTKYISKLTKAALERRHQRRSGVFVINFEEVNSSGECLYFSLINPFETDVNIVFKPASSNNFQGKLIDLVYIIGKLTKKRLKATNKLRFTCSKSTI